MKVLIAHYSLLGHTNRLAVAVMQGAKEIEGAEVKLMRVPEILSDEEINRRGAGDFRKSFENIPICSPDDVALADAIILGAPTYLGNMCAQMSAFPKFPREAMARWCFGGKSRQRLHQLWLAAWRTRGSSSQRAYNHAPSGNDCGGSSLYLPRPIAHR